VIYSLLITARRYRLDPAAWLSVSASDPDLHPSQPARVATLELEASGCLTVEVDWGAVACDRPRQTRNHHTLASAWEPWGSPHGYV
jgi:hypothetical protein